MTIEERLAQEQAKTEEAIERQAAQWKAAEFSLEIYHLTEAQRNLTELLEKTTSSTAQSSLVPMMQEIQRRLTVLLS